MLVYHVVDPLAPLPPGKGSPVVLTPGILTLPDVPAFPTPIVRQFQRDRLPVLTVKFVDQLENPISLFSNTNTAETVTDPGVSAAGFPRLPFQTGNILAPGFRRDVWLRIGELGSPSLLNTKMTLPPDPTEPLVTDLLGDFTGWVPSGLATYAWTALDLPEAGTFIGEVSWSDVALGITAFGFHTLEGTATAAGFFQLTITVPPVLPATVPTVTVISVPVNIGDTALDVALGTTLTPLLDMALAQPPLALPTDPVELAYFFPARGVAGNGITVAVTAPAGLTLSVPDVTLAGGTEDETFDRVIGQFKLVVMPTVRAI